MMNTIEAFPLISALSKYNIATTFFDAKKESLPQNRFRDVRVLFLDINLNGGAQPNWATEKAMLISSINSIIEPNTPYILFVWSVNEGAHLADLIKLFDEELREYKPIAPLIPMEKTNMFKQEVEGDKITWTLNFSVEETIEFIKQKINAGISNIDSFEALLKWENIVSESSALVVNDILILAASKGNINTDLKQIYYNLAHAYWGKTLTGKTEDAIIAKSIVNLNSILADKIEFAIANELKIELLKGFPTAPTIDFSINPQLNTRLLFSEDLIDEPTPGNLYILENDSFKKAIVEDLIDRSKFGVDYCLEKDIEKKDFYEGQEIKKEHKKGFNSYFFQKIEQIVAEALFIELELTPICDYSQGNRIFCRMVSGVILDVKYWSKRKNSASYFYPSPMFLLDEKVVNFYCDFRYIKSVDVKSMTGIKPRLRIRHLFQSDMQSHMARQVSRPGIVSL